ncbi:DUF2771 domain-containing protein [Modestobacter versicolor]|uniref:DUF2771 domain-containing protein n=1 Tax=Modestobacter versicolor TaxID=429133 RepID=UPI0034DECC36
MNGAGRASAGVALLAALGVLTGCGDAGDDKEVVPTLAVRAGGDEITADATQYCLDGDGQRFQTSAPIIEVAPDTTIELTVSEAVAAAGWSVQVFDEELQQILGEVDVPAGESTFSEITSSDVAPPTFYLVVVETADPDACSGLSGAWPVGFIRAGG